jgi:hypothetical protein
MKAGAPALAPPAASVIAVLLHLAGRFRKRWRRFKSNLEAVGSIVAETQELRRIVKRQYPRLDL